jgi:YbbR domain-containing protein
MITFLRNLIERDFWLKLFSLVLAILIWLLVSFTIHKEAAPVRIFNIPVLITSSVGNVHNLRAQPVEVEVKVRGEARKLEELETKDIRAFVDATGVQTVPGFRKIEITVPADITFVQVTPTEVEVVPLAITK